MSNTDHDLLEQYLQDPDGFGLPEIGGLDPVLCEAVIRGRISAILSGKYRAPDSIALSRDDRARLEMARQLQSPEKMPPLESITLSFELKNALRAWKSARIQLNEHQGDLLTSIEETRKQLELVAKMGSAQASLIDPDFVFRGISPETIQDYHQSRRKKLQGTLQSFYRRLTKTREARQLQKAQVQVVAQLHESGLIE